MRPQNSNRPRILTEKQITYLVSKRLTSKIIPLKILF